MANKKLSQITEEATNLSNANKFYVEQGLVSKFTLWSTIKSGIQAIITFLSLPDTPNSFAGQALKILRVNAGEDAVEFVAAGGDSANSQFRAINASVLGTTDTAIYKFNTIIDNFDNDDCFTVTDTAANGTFITVDKKGVYGISISLQSNISVTGLSLNSTQLTTGIQGIAEADSIILETDGAINQNNTSAWIGILNIGDKIRCHATVGITIQEPERNKFVFVLIGLI